MYRTSMLVTGAACILYAIAFVANDVFFDVFFRTEVWNESKESAVVDYLSLCVGWALVSHGLFSMVAAGAESLRQQKNFVLIQATIFMVWSIFDWVHFDTCVSSFNLINSLFSNGLALLFVYIAFSLFRRERSQLTMMFPTTVSST